MLSFKVGVLGTLPEQHLCPCIELAGLRLVLLIEILFVAVEPTAKPDQSRIPSA